MEFEIHSTIHHHDLCMIDRFGLTTSSSVKTILLTECIHVLCESLRVSGYCFKHCYAVGLCNGDSVISVR